MSSVSTSADTSTDAKGMARTELPGIRAHLEKVLDSETFSATTRLKRLLVFLVESSLKSQPGPINGYVIGLEVFDKREDFDPSTDPIVRVMIGKLRERLTLYYSREGKRDPLRIVVPKGHYTPRFEPPDAGLATLGAPVDRAPELIAKIEQNSEKSARVFLNNARIGHLSPALIMRINRGLLKAGYNPAKLAKHFFGRTNLR